MPAFFAPRGAQPRGSEPRSSALMDAALASQPIRDRVKAFNDVFSNQADLLIEGQFHYAKLVKASLESHLQTYADSLVSDPAQNEKVNATITAEIAKASKFANDHGPDILKTPSVVAGYKLGDAERTILNAMGASNVELVFPKSTGGAPGLAKMKAEVMAFIDQQTSELKINTTGTPDSKVWNIYQLMFAIACAKERCFLSVGRIAKAYRFVTKGTASQVGQFGLLVDGAKPYKDSILNPKGPNILLYPLTNGVLARTLNNLILTLEKDIPIRAGVLSGDKSDMAIYPTPEHYLLIIGAFPMPAFGAVVFLFWDPDQGDSDIVKAIGNPAFSPNFGFLFAYFEDAPVRGRGGGMVERLFFSTGFSLEDVADSLQPSFNFGLPPKAGFHRTYRTRHRYQVLSLWNTI